MLSFKANDIRNLQYECSSFTLTSSEIETLTDTETTKLFYLCLDLFWRVCQVDGSSGITGTHLCLRPLEGRDEHRVYECRLWTANPRSHVSRHAEVWVLKHIEYSYTTPRRVFPWHCSSCSGHQMELHTPLQQWSIVVLTTMRSVSAAQISLHLFT